MNRLIPIKLAIKALRANPGRTVLTTLGIVIGIAAVILVVSAGAGFRSFIDSQVEQFGTNFLTVETRVPPTTRTRDSQTQNPISAASQIAITTLKTRDLEAIKNIPNIQGAYGVAVGQQVVSYGEKKKTSIIFGSDPDRFEIDKQKLVQGRFYTESENQGAEQLAILGFDIAKDLFGDDDPVDKTIRVGSFNFRVVGVYEASGSFGFNNTDQQIFAPLLTLQKKILGIDYLFYILAEVENSDLSEATAQDVRLLLRQNHGIIDPVKDDFLVQTQAQGLATFETILSGVQFLLIAVAAISLIVGGVGIMNIMYVSVTERVSEIGLKKALGAKNLDVLTEFLFEAVLLTLLGGFFGILLGSALGYLVSIVAQKADLAWQFRVPLSGVALGLGVAGSIGLIFGVFPARRASKLDPIEALRQE